MTCLRADGSRLGHPQSAPLAMLPRHVFSSGASVIPLASVRHASAGRVANRSARQAMSHVPYLRGQASRLPSPLTQAGKTHLRGSVGGRRGPTSSPHQDFGPCEAFCRLTPIGLVRGAVRRHARPHAPRHRRGPACPFLPRLRRGKLCPEPARNMRVRPERAAAAASRRACP